MARQRRLIGAAWGLCIGTLAAGYGWLWITPSWWWAAAILVCGVAGGISGHTEAASRTGPEMW